MKAIVQDLFVAQDITSADTVGSEVNQQMISDEVGTVQITLNQDPGAAAEGFIYIEGKMKTDDAWGALASYDLAGMQSASGTGLVTFLTGVPLVNHMRAATRDPNSNYSIAASTTATIRIQS